MKKELCAVLAELIEAEGAVARLSGLQECDDLDDLREDLAELSGDAP